MWTRIRTANFGSEANSLYGVAALPDGTAWATGIYTTANGHEGRALTEHWNGHAWTVVPAANPGSAEDILYSVTARSDSDVWAVGSYADSSGYFHPLVEHWNGRRWTADSLSAAGATNGILTSVTSAGQGVWATGQVTDGESDRQVVVHLVHRSWQVVPPNPVLTPGGSVADAYPQAIADSPAGLWLAGRDRAGHAASLIEYGSASGGWTTVPSPNPGAANGDTILDGVLAFSSSNVWAVGEYDGANGMRTLILHYTG